MSSFPYQTFAKAFDQGCKDSIIIDLLPKLYLDSNDITNSILFFEKLIASSDDYPHYNKALAELYRKSGKFQQSLHIYKDLVEKDPNYLKDACTLCDNLLLSYPSHPFILEQAFYFFVKDCNPTHALIHLETLCDLNAHELSDLNSLYKTLLMYFISSNVLLFSY